MLISCNDDLKGFVIYFLSDLFNPDLGSYENFCLCFFNVLSSDNKKVISS